MWRDDSKKPNYRLGVLLRKPLFPGPAGDREIDILQTPTPTSTKPHFQPFCGCLLSGESATSDSILVEEMVPEKDLSKYLVPGSDKTYYIPNFVSGDEEAYLLRKVSGW